MKKHIFGFAVFSLIVGVAVVVSNLLFSETPKLNIGNTPVPHYSEGTYCWKYRRQNAKVETASVKIEQAVFDLKTKQLKTSLSVNPQSETPKNYRLALHFFIKDGKTSRYVSTERVWVNSLFNSEKETLVTSWRWLEKLDSHDNLYIVPEIAEDWKDYQENPPTFNYTTAAPVLLSKGKGF